MGLLRQLDMVSGDMALTKEGTPEVYLLLVSQLLLSFPLLLCCLCGHLNSGQCLSRGQPSASGQHSLVSAEQRLGSGWVVSSADYRS